MERRGFIQRVLTLGLAGIHGILAGGVSLVHLVGTAMWTENSVSDWLDLGPIEDFTEEEVPLPKTIEIETRDAWQRIRRTQVVFAFKKGNKFQVLSSLCPHLACGVRFDPQENRFICPCHQSVFDSQGSVLAGPSPRGLDPLPVKKENGHLFCRWILYETGRSDRREI